MPTCYNCFNEYEGSGACPHCGYDESGEREKYPHALPHGTILAGSYITGRVLGQGGFGITYVAREHKTGNRVAIKEFYPEAISSRGASNAIVPFSGQRTEDFNYGKSTFLDEAEDLAKFNGNPHIVSVYSYFEENGTAYFAMEYVEGKSLQTYIKEHNGRISCEEAEKLLLPIMEALEEVHSTGIIHRDIKPDNIMLTADGQAKLLDFGSARYSMGEKSRSLDVVLTHGFSPREQYSRHGRQGAYTDVYALAATFYYTITGRVPPDSIDRADDDDIIFPSSLGVAISQEKEDALMKALAVKVPDRFQNVREFREALIGNEPISEPVAESVNFVSDSAPGKSVQNFTESTPDTTLRTESETSMPAVTTNNKSMATVPKWLIPSAVGLIVVLAVVLAFVIGMNAGSGKIETKEPDFSVTTTTPATTQKNTATTITVPVSDVIYTDAKNFEYEEESGGITITKYIGTDTEVSIPKTINGKAVKKIGEKAFDKCESLKKVTIPDSMITIGFLAFGSCTSLTDITIPNSVKSFGGSPFAGTLWLKAKRKENPFVIVNNILIDGTTTTGDVTIPSSVTSIGDQAFLGCTSLESITFSDSVTSIGKSAFAWCDNLKSITIPGSIKSIGEGAFERCGNLTSVSLPNSVTSINKEAFFECSSLTSITIPDSVTKIGESAFKRCSSLTSITIPDSVENIGAYAFFSCIGLKSITIPNGVTNIGFGTFEYCTSLTSVSLPKKCKVADDAFDGCPNVKITYR